MPRRFLLLFMVVLYALSPYLVACKREVTNKKEFTEAEVAEVQTVLRDLNPTRYHVVLPEINNGRVIGSKTYGTLPITEVRRIASARGINYVETGNVQLIFADEGGGAGSHTESQSGGSGSGSGGGSGGGGGGASGGGGGAGSHTESQSGGSKGEAIKRIENILANIDKSQYIFIH